MNKQENDPIEQNIRKLTSNQPNSFSTPVNYFDQLHADLMTRTNILEKSTQEVYCVPTDYFETLPSQINDRVIQRSSKISFSFYSKPKFLIPIGLTMALIVTTCYFSFHNKNISSDTSSVTVEDIRSCGYLLDLDEQVIMDVLVKQSPFTNQSSDIEQYLLDNHIDISQLSSAL